MPCARRGAHLPPDQFAHATHPPRLRTRGTTPHTLRREGAWTAIGHLRGVQDAQVSRLELASLSHTQQLARRTLQRVIVKHMEILR